MRIEPSWMELRELSQLHSAMGGYHEIALYSPEEGPHQNSTVLVPWSQLPATRQWETNFCYILLNQPVVLCYSSLRSVTQLCPTLCDPMDCQASMFITNYEACSNSSSWWYDPIISSSYDPHPLLLLPSILPSIRVFSNESVCIRWPKYWSFSFSISPSNEFQDWFPVGLTVDLLAVQGTLKSLLQHHSSKASVLQCSYKCKH